MLMLMHLKFQEPSVTPDPNGQCIIFILIKDRICIKFRGENILVRVNLSQGSFQTKVMFGVSCE